MEAAPASICSGSAYGAADLQSLSVTISDGAGGVSLSEEQLSEDYRREVVHSLKAGLAIALVSTFYCLRPLCDSFVMNVAWAILTSATVFEPTVGATLARGLNRILATIVATALGIGAHRVAGLSGRTLEPILLGFFVFLIAVLATFVRFLPRIKVRSYDHRVMLFNITLGITTLSGHPEDQVITVTLTRTSTIVLGCCIAVTVFVFILPSWSGKELLDLTTVDMDILGKSLQGFGIEHLDIMDEHKTVLTSKHITEAMAYFAGWEPEHSEFRLGHPWKKYVTVGSLIRLCAYKTKALNDFRGSKIAISTDARSRAEELCELVTIGCGNSLREMASTLRKMTPPRATANQCPAASNDLQRILRSEMWENARLSETEAAPAELYSHLIDITECVERISRAMNELASLAASKNRAAISGGDKHASSGEIECSPLDLSRSHVSSE